MISEEAWDDKISEETLDRPFDYGTSYSSWYPPSGKI